MSDIREALESAFAEEETNDSSPQVVSEPAQDEAPALERNRDEQGRFSAGNEPAPSADPAPQEVPEIKAPSSWKPEAKAAYIKAERGEPLTAQEIKVLTAEANRRESDFLKGLEEFKGHAQKARTYEQAIAPYAQNFQKLGLDATTAISKLLETDHRLRNSDPDTKARYFADLAAQYGVALNQVANPNVPVDPQTQYLMQQLNELRQTQQMWQNSIQQQEQAKAQYEIEQFAGADKTHFEAVRGDMADLLESGKAQSLEQAYEMAVWMRPDIRQTLIEQQQIEAQKKYEEQQRAQKAKAASVSVRGSSPSSTGSQPVTGSLRDILEAQFDK